MASRLPRPPLVVSVVGLSVFGWLALPALPALADVPVSCNAPKLVQAVAEANAAGYPITIVLTRNCRYTLTSALPEITGNITFDGRGATIARGPRAREFRIATVAKNGTLAARNLTITGGLAPSGAGIANFGTLVLDYVAVVGNRTKPGGSGGGIYSSGDLTVRHSELSDNRTGDGGEAGPGEWGREAGAGGAIALDFVDNSPQSRATIDDTLIKDNLTGRGGAGGAGLVGEQGGHAGDGGDGGAISSDSTLLTITNSVITGNRTGNGGTGGDGGVAGPDGLSGSGGGGGSGGEGGWLYVYNGSTTKVSNTRITGNRTGNGGRGGNAPAGAAGEWHGNGGSGGDGGLGGGAFFGWHGPDGRTAQFDGVRIEQNRAGPAGAGGATAATGGQPGADGEPGVGGGVHQGRRSQTHIQLGAGSRVTGNLPDNCQPADLAGCG